MKRKIGGFVAAALLIASLFVPAPLATAQFGQYSCRGCTLICWTGAWVFESCEYFCVAEAGHVVGYSECYSGATWCQRIDRCVRLVA